MKVNKKGLTALSIILALALVLFGVWRSRALTCRECTTECGGRLGEVRWCKQECHTINTPSAPTNLSASEVEDDRIGIYPWIPTLKFVWTDNSNKEASFVIERAQDRSGPWEEIAEVPANVTSFLLDWRPEGPPGYYGPWYYRVRARNSCGESEPSNVLRRA